MPNFSATITGYATGDSLIIRRTIDRSASNLPSGVYLTKAWLTVKAAESDADVDAIIQKEITTTDTPGTGQLEDDGNGDTDPILRFDLTPANTRDIGEVHRYYDIQVMLSVNNSIYTGEKGEIWGEGDITLATS